MEDNRQDKDLKQAEKNTGTGEETSGKTSRKTRHTWIGDKDEIRPDGADRPVTRMTIPDAGARGTKMISTKVVERPKKPYRGFITDEEIRQAEAAAEIDRMALAESRAAREQMAQTRIYGAVDVPDAEAEKPEETAEKTKPRRKKSFSIQVTDSKKFRRLVAILAVFAVLLAFEISFAVMKARTSALPGSTAKLRSKTETLQANNKQLQESIDKLGDYDEIKAKKDSWQKTKEQLEQLK